MITEFTFDDSVILVNTVTLKNLLVVNICNKTNSAFGFFRKNLAACLHDLDEIVCKGLVRMLDQVGIPRLQGELPRRCRTVQGL